MNIPLQRNFWKYARLCEEDFQKVADTGDLLLFKTPELGSQLQRFITNSNFNHIAVVLRSSTGALKFIEATIEYGVDIIDWDTFMAYRCYANFERCVYRRLCGFTRTKDRLRRLEDFIKVAKHKRYSLAATKLLRKHCSNDSDNHIREDKTYFCSELVASIYKNLGLLPGDISASQYWPVNFS
jgi:Permuted papain-like amidase enzyme, YaeF/YiiX, C92 family